MLIAVIIGPDLVSAQQQINQVATQVNALELRLDYFVDLKVVPILMQQTTLPVILTLRSQAQGGKFAGDIHEKLAVYETLANYGPAYLDIDTEMPAECVANLRQQFPHIKWIYSYHNLLDTKLDLAQTLEKMQAAHADIYKIVTMANSAHDALRMMKFIKAINRSDVIAFCMGAAGQWTRIIAPMFGGMVMHYLAVNADNCVADGQLTVAEWQQHYQAPQFDKHTKVYALIGDPVAQSIGHIYHNKNFKQHNKNAVYVKIMLGVDALAEFFTLVKDSAVKGLSVTMPLKNAVLPFIDVLEDSAGAPCAVNTIIFADKIIGKNTDGTGVLQALSQKTKLRGNKAIILGAGNTARAIAIALKTQGVTVMLIARNIMAQQDWAQQHDIPMKDFAAFAADVNYDILINATPVGMRNISVDNCAWLVPEIFLPGCVVLDCIISQNETPFLQFAKACGCITISGVEMFFEQARVQF